MDVRVLRLIESAAPLVPEAHRVERDCLWDEAVSANPTGFFDGPAVVCADLDREERDTVVLSWARVTYRYFALRWVSGAFVLPSVFVAVAQPTDEGGLLVGRMSPHTAAPDRLQLPGGSVEPPVGHAGLDVTALRRHAAHELLEETGVEVRPQDLMLWTLSRGEHGNIGVFFRAPALPEALIRERFSALLSAEEAAGREPELREIAFPCSVAEEEKVGGPQVDYLAPLIALHARTQAPDPHLQVLDHGVPSHAPW